jgi:archaetidylinositol phosphate synthase
VRSTESAAAAPRESRFLLARSERRVLEWLARRVPAWMVPDHFTLIGVTSAVGIAVAYALSNVSEAWVWAASALLVLHWIGDSLDGTLARVRGTERPRYGYYLDHLTDALATAAVGIGLGLSPYMGLATGLVIVIAYLLLSINVYLEASSLRSFRAAYGRVGPTEVRVVLIVLNAALALGWAPFGWLQLFGLGPFDLIVIAAAALMVTTLAVRAAANLGTLAAEEPPPGPRPRVRRPRADHA